MRAMNLLRVFPVVTLQSCSTCPELHDMPRTSVCSMQEVNFMTWRRQALHQHSCCAQGCNPNRQTSSLIMNWM